MTETTKLKRKLKRALKREQTLKRKLKRALKRERALKRDLAEGGKSCVDLDWNWNSGAEDA